MALTKHHNVQFPAKVAISTKQARECVRSSDLLSPIMSYVLPILTSDCASRINEILWLSQGSGIRLRFDLNPDMALIPIDPTRQYAFQRDLHLTFRGSKQENNVYGKEVKYISIALSTFRIEKCTQC